MLSVVISQWWRDTCRIGEKQREKSVTPAADQSAVFRCDERVGLLTMADARAIGFGRGI